MSDEMNDKIKELQQQIFYEKVLNKIFNIVENIKDNKDNKGQLENPKTKLNCEATEHYNNIFSSIEINNSYNGSALEIILCYLFTRENINITNMDENIDVMFVKPDFLLIGNNNKKIFVSAKVKDVS